MPRQIFQRLPRGQDWRLESDHLLRFCCWDNNRGCGRAAGAECGDEEPRAELTRVGLGQGRISQSMIEYGVQAGQESRQDQLRHQ